MRREFVVEALLGAFLVLAGVKVRRPHPVGEKSHGRSETLLRTLCSPGGKSCLEVLVSHFTSSALDGGSTG